MPFSQTQHAASECEENRPRTYTVIGLLFTKQRHPHASAGRWPLPSSSVRVEYYREASSEQWTPKHFQACERREDLLELANHQVWQTLLELGGSGAKALKGGRMPREMIVWRQDGGAVTCSVLSHLQGIGRLLLDFMMLTSVSWLTHVRRHLREAGKGGKDWPLDFPPTPGIPTPHLSPIVTTIGSEN